MGRQLVKIIKQICKEEGITIKSYSDEYVLQLEANHRNMYIFGNKFPNNNAGSEQICNDKSALSSILSEFQIPNVPHFYFDSPVREEYYPSTGIWKELSGLLDRYHGLICKVNNGTGGNNVYKVQTQQELEEAVLKIFKVSNSMAVSPLVNIDQEYRIVMVDGEMQFVYKKILPSVIGDGVHTIRELIQGCEWSSPSFISDDINLSFVPNRGEIVRISWKHNLGQGATPVLVTDSDILNKLDIIAKKCVDALDLGFVSIDVVESLGNLQVLEINSGVMVERFSAYSEEYYNLAKSAVRNAIKKYLRLDMKYELTRTQRAHYVLPVITKIAKDKNIKIVEDQDEHNFAIFIFENNNSFVARDYPFNINYGGSIALCQNKSACSSFIRALGYSTPKEKYFVKKNKIQTTLTEIEKFLYAPEKTLGFSYPMVIKPNDRAQGEGVFIVHTAKEAISCAQEAFCKSKIILLQEFCRGDEYRIVVLNGKILQAYQRIPFSIVGNGESTIKELIASKVQLFKAYGRDKEVNPSDSRILSHIKSEGYCEDSILPVGKVLKLQDIANLSLGGESREALDKMDSRFAEMAISLARSFNLKLCGIDIIATNISNFSLGYNILEINSAPGLDNYLYGKEKQKKYVEGLYKKIFEEIQKMIE